jgi:hypothetical protein
MSSVMIPQQPDVIKTKDVPQDPAFENLRIVRFQSDENARDNYLARRYQFQYEFAEYTVVRATLCRKGTANRPRIVVIVHPTMKMFTEIIKYNPADPAIMFQSNYEAQWMKEAHERTQSDFKGQKKANMIDFKNYILEGVTGDRTLYLPPVTGWQASHVFDKTVFVSLDELDPNALYGDLYLPKAPIMQADGQTQTAAVFEAAKSADAFKSGTLDTLTLTVEIELNMDETKAGQSFADRNGRGSKKNKNLVINLDTSSALSTLRVRAIKDTVFENRVNNGRNKGTTETATTNIVDLSTLEQMFLDVISNGRHKPERIKHYYIDDFLPYCREFIELLERHFAHEWLEDTPPNRDPFRKIFVHGWPFALKAIAKAYHQTRIAELGPLAEAIGTEGEDTDGKKTQREKFESQVKKKRDAFEKMPPISFEELDMRLGQIDWRRYRKHWITLTGYAVANGKKKTFKLKETGEDKVVAKAQNTASIISSVADKILSDRWVELTQTEDEPLDDQPLDNAPERKIEGQDAGPVM